MNARFGAAQFFLGAWLCACASAQPEVHASANSSLDAGADAARPNEADAANEDARAPLAVAPPLDVGAPAGFAEESRGEISVETEGKIDIAFATDSCVRVAFTSGDAVTASLATAHVDSATRGMLGPRGPLCERAGKQLALIFSGNANVRYVVFRSMK